MQKIYVRVEAEFDPTGYMQPRSITWADGRVFPIEKIQDFRPAKTVCQHDGDCFVILLAGQERLLFFERLGQVFSGHVGRWYVEVPE